MWNYPENNLVQKMLIPFQNIIQYFYVFLRLTDHKNLEYKRFFPVIPIVLKHSNNTEWSSESNAFLRPRKAAHTIWRWSRAFTIVSFSDNSKQTITYLLIRPTTIISILIRTHKVVFLTITVQLICNKFCFSHRELAIIWRVIMWFMFVHSYHIIMLPVTYVGKIQTVLKIDINMLVTQQSQESIQV